MLGALVYAVHSDHTKWLRASARKDLDASLLFIALSFLACCGALGCYPNQWRLRQRLPSHGSGSRSPEAKSLVICALGSSRMSSALHRTPASHVALAEIHRYPL